MYGVGRDLRHLPGESEANNVKCHNPRWYNLQLYELLLEFYTCACVCGISFSPLSNVRATV